MPKAPRIALVWAFELMEPPKSLLFTVASIDARIEFRFSVYRLYFLVKHPALMSIYCLLNLALFRYS